MPITVVIPTVYAPPRAWAAAKLLVDQVAAVGGEIVVASGHDIAAPEPPPPVRVVHEPGADVFALRAAAVTVARGEVVSMLEDHIEVAPDYCARILRAFASNESALALVGTVANGEPRVLDRASFLLTWGPFLAPLPEVPRDRCPPPGAISFRGSALPDTVPHTGFLEYELPVRIRDEGRMTVAEDVEVCHSQRVGMRGFSLQYHAGRGYTGLEHDLRSSVRRRDQLREAARVPGILLRQTRAGLGRSGHRETFTCMAAVTAFALCNAFGQMVGVVRGPGGSPKHLE